MTILAEQVSKSYFRRQQEIQALAAVDLTVADGEFVAFVGPSGCGKSTLLNLMAGIVAPTRGRIVHDGRVVTGANTRVGYMTQVDSLLPWRSAEHNVALPLEVRGVSTAERNRIAAEMLALVNLTRFAKHYPNELSGGMRKRVALAQVLAYDPGTILMDEPFGALDAQLKLVMQAELLRIWEARRKTIVFVSHDLGEAIAMADRVIVFRNRPGRIGRVQEIDLARPRDVFRMRFDARFQEIYEDLWGELSQEIRREEEL